MPFSKEVVMEIPKTIKIGGYTVEVKFASNMMTDRRNMGEYHPRTQTIKIDSDCSKQQSEETLIHELLEAITSIYDIAIEHKDLSNLATVLHQVIKDNPQMFMA
jgi:hypothetical protein